MTWWLRGHAVMVVAVASLIVNGAMLAVLGIRSGSDTAEYLAAAERLLHAHEVEGRRATSSFAFVTVLALSLASSTGVAGLIVLHLAAGAAAAAALYRMGEALFSERAAWVAATLFIFNFDTARWVNYVLTDWLYACFVVASAWALWRAVDGASMWRWGALATVVFTALLRPNGWLVVLVGALYVLAEYGRRRAWPATRRRVAGVAAAALFAAGAGTLTMVTGQADAVQADRWLRSGRVIWGSAGWHVRMPPDPAPESGLAAGARYALKHPLASTKLAVTRIAVEVSAARPYYSRIHNVVALAVYLPLHLFALYGAYESRRGPLRALLGGVIVTHLLLVGVTFSDYDGRFLMHVTPLITLFAAGGIANVKVRTVRPSSGDGRP